MKLDAEPTKSPITAVYRHVVVALRKIAPEKWGRIEGREDHLTLRVPDIGRWIFEASPSMDVVVLSRGALEIVWSLAYGYVMLHRARYEEGLGEHFDPHSEPFTAPAVRLLDWAMERWATGEDSTWPDDLPRPVVDAPLGTMENVADELALCATALFLHHEVAHCQPENLAEPNELLREKLADLEAAKILLDEAGGNITFFWKRALAVAVGFSAMVGYGIKRRDNGGSEGHPPHHERLLDALEPYISDDASHLAWKMAVAVLDYHARRAGLPDPLVGGTYREKAHAYARLLDAQQTSK